MIESLKLTDLGSFEEFATMEMNRLLEALRIASELIELRTSGPGGIMEMKQTIADKEAELNECNLSFNAQVEENYLQSLDIERLETALEHTMECFLGARKALKECVIERDEARKALKGKEPLEWTENYGQGAEPWLEDTK